MKALCFAPVVLTFAASLAGAQVTPIGPFQGVVSEGFESQPAQAGVPCVVGRIFAGHADICGAISLVAAVVPAATPVVPGPRSGARMFHTEWGVTVDFDRPVQRFGGYFGGLPGDAIFLDASGQLVEQTQYLTTCNPANCEWKWNGWQFPSAMPVQRIILFGLGATGGFFQLDDLQVDFACDSQASNYCTAGQSALGCTAFVLASGTASATAASDFQLFAGGLESQIESMFFYGTNGRQALPWGNGTSFQCIAPPVKRGGLLPPTGVFGGLCSGNVTQDLNARWCPTCPRPGHNPGAGAVVQAQLWYRDPQNTSNRTTSLSNAIEFTVCP